MAAGFAAAGALSDIAWPFYAGLAAAALLFAWQVITLKMANAADCLTKFKLNFWVGAVIFAGIVGAHALD